MDEIDKAVHSQIQRMIRQSPDEPTMANIRILIPKQLVELSSRSRVPAGHERARRSQHSRRRRTLGRAQPRNHPPVAVAEARRAGGRYRCDLGAAAVLGFPAD